VLGGIGNLTGAVLGGLMLGLIGAYSSLYIGDRWTDVVIFFDPRDRAHLPTHRPARPAGGLARVSASASVDIAATLPARSPRAIVGALSPSWLTSEQGLAFRNRWGAVMVLGVALAFPFIDQALGLAMLNPMLSILTSIILAMGLNIVVGMAGLLDLGYVAFFAIGAYVVGMGASGMFTGVPFHLLSGLPHVLPGIHISIWLLFPIAAAVTALFGVLLGAPTLRLRGDYLAIVTLGFGEIIPRVFQNGDSIAGHNLTNGTRGISGLDTPSMGGAAVDNALGAGWGTWGPLNMWPWYFLGLGLCVLGWYVSVTMQWSKLGRAWMAIREDETAASAMGIDLVRTKLWAYGIGASFGGLAGVYQGARIGSVFPASFQFYISISLLCMVIIGGMGNVWGAILGAIIVEGLNRWMLPSLTTWGAQLGIHIQFSNWNMMIFGVILVLMMLYRPQGFLPNKARIIQFDELPELDAALASKVAAYEQSQAASRHLVDPVHAGHAAHYPTALHGPDGAGGGVPAHPVLEAGAVGQMHLPHLPHHAPRSKPATDWPGAPRFPRFGEGPGFGQGPTTGGAPA